MRTLGVLLMVVCTASPCLGDEGRPEARTTRGVTFDVKDADLRDVLESMQQQCAIKNLVIDPDVQGRVVRLKFREVPCTTAFKVVFGQFGLTGQIDRNVTTVEPRKN